MWDMDTVSSTSLKQRFSSHHLRGIRTCGGSGERLKPQPRAAHATGDTGGVECMGKDGTGEENKPGRVQNRPNQKVRVLSVSPNPLTMLPLKSHE